MSRTRFTEKAVEKIKPGQKRREIPDAILPGLYLIVQKSGSKSWAIRYRRGPNVLKYTIGPYPKFDLGTARELAGEAFKKVAKGLDPAAEKREERRRAAAGLTESDLFGANYEDYERRHIDAKLSDKTAYALKSIFRVHILPRWRKRRLSEIVRGDVIALHEDIKAPVVANNAYRSARGFFNWCVARGKLAASPCPVKFPLHRESARDRKLSDDEIRWAWKACDKIGHPFGAIFKLLFLTAARRSEVADMIESELKDSPTWKIPGARTKNGLPHEIELSDLALGILEKAPRKKNKAGYVFTTNGKTPPSGFSRAKRNLDKEMLKIARAEAESRGLNPAKLKIEPWAIHDARRTAASGMARLGIQLPVIERCLNHISGSFAGIVGVYQQHEFAEEKKAAFKAWASFVKTVVESVPASNVVPIPTRRARR